MLRCRAGLGTLGRRLRYCRHVRRFLSSRGEVDRARDTKLGREVVGKILPATFSDPERVARFGRKAQVLAASIHPHITQIFGLKSDRKPFLELELVGR